MENETRPILSEEDLTYVYRTLVKYWIRRGRRQDAEDLAQEGLLQCVAKVDRYKAKKGFQGRTATLRTFLVTVGKNRGKDCLKSEERYERRLREILERFEAV